VIEAGRQSDGFFDFNDVLTPLLALAGESERLPANCYIDGLDQSSLLLATDGLSNRKYHYYWLVNKFLWVALRRIQNAADGDQR
jgi:arylsulfatase